MTSKKSRKRIVSDSPATHPTPSSGNGFENGWEVPAGNQPAAASSIKQKSILAYFNPILSQQAAVSMPSTDASNASYTAETGLQVASRESPGKSDVNVQESSPSTSLLVPDVCEPNSSSYDEKAAGHCTHGLSPIQLKRKLAKEQKQAEKAQQLLTELRTELTAVVDQQIGMHQVLDPTSKQQHSQDWQLAHMPRRCVLVSTGHQQLVHKIDNFKVQVANQGTDTSRELLAHHLDWKCIPSPHDRVDAEQIKQKLITHTNQQLAKLSAADAKRLGWKLGQIPRKSALEQAGLGTLEQQIATFQYSSHGAGGRQRLASAIGWKLAKQPPRGMALQDKDLSVAIPPKVAERQRAKQMKRDATLSKKLEELRQALTSAIDEQVQLRLKLTDPDVVAQHEQDWQQQRVPRAWAIKQAGYKQLFRKVQNYKRDCGHQGPETNIQLLTMNLAWGSPNVLVARCDAQKLKAELEDVIRNQRQQLSDDDPELADWQLEQMPRTTALSKAGYPTLANQVHSYLHGAHGPGGRQRLAKQLGWSVAPRVFPHYTLAEMKDRLQEAIAAQRAAVGPDDADWQDGHVPRVVALRNAGYPMLAETVENYKQHAARKDSSIPSGRAGLAHDLGWDVSPLRNGPAAEAQEIAKELTDVIQKQQQLLGLDAEGWQDQVVPRTRVLQQAGYTRLANQIQSYRQVGSSTDRGRSAFAADVGWTLAASAIAEAGVYQDWHDCVAKAQQVMAADTKYSDPDTTPSKRWFIQQGYGSMVQVVIMRHFPAEHGGWAQFMQHCGRRILRIHNGSMSVSNILRKLRGYIAASEHPDQMPLMQELHTIGSDWNHPLCDHARGLAVAINKSGLQAADFAKTLGMKPRGNIFKTAQELALLESVLREEPNLTWPELTARYNTQRGAMQERTSSSLEHLFVRTKEPSMQRLVCARKLRLRTTADLERFEQVLGSKLVADDSKVLDELSACASDVHRLAHVAELDVPSLLLQMPGCIGDPAWLLALKENEEIEAQVQSWRGAMQQQLRGNLSMAQVWDQTPELQPFKTHRLQLSLNNQLLVAALKQLAEQSFEEDNTATAAAAQQERRLQADFFSKAVAFNLVKRLPDLACIKSRIQTVLLEQQGSQLETLQTWQYDSNILPVLPPELQERIRQEGRIEDPAAIKFSKFWPMDFANAQALRRAAGVSPGIYQIFLCRYETQADGTRTLVMRTEWYVGAASVAFSGRIPDYLPLTKCGHPGPHEEVTKRCLFWAACEHGFEFEMRFLPLPGFTPAEVFEVESHYLQFKWPLNMQQNCHVRTHPPLQMPSRLADPVRLTMAPRIDDYDRDSKHAHGLAQLAATHARAFASGTPSDQADAQVASLILANDEIATESEYSYDGSDTDSECDSSECCGMDAEELQ